MHTRTCSVACVSRVCVWVFVSGSTKAEQKCARTVWFPTNMNAGAKVHTCMFGVSRTTLLRVLVVGQTHRPGLLPTRLKR